MLRRILRSILAAFIPASASAAAVDRAPGTEDRWLDARMDELAKSVLKTLLEDGGTAAAGRDATATTTAASARSGSPEAARSKAEVAARAMSLLIVAYRAALDESPDMSAHVEDYGLSGALSPREREFLSNPEPSFAERVASSWRYESAWVLLWALGYVELGAPTEMCDNEVATRILSSRTAAEFLADAKLRTPGEMERQQERAEQFHWLIRDAHIRGKPLPEGLEPSVIAQRHYVLNWLTGVGGDDWDDIITDT